MTGFRLFAAFLLVCLAGAEAALARSHALVIGNDTYVDVPSLQKARNDATAVGEKLKAMGFSVTMAMDQSRDEFSRSLAAFMQAVEPGDTAFFFYAGHGFALRGENFLLPTDVPAAGPGDEDIVQDASFAVSDIVERLQKRGATTTILVLDACRDNPFKSDRGRTIGSDRGLVRVDPPQGVFVLFSAGSGQSALDRLSDDDPAVNSVFTRVLLEGLDREGASLVRIAKETQVAVRSLAAKVGHEQTPAYYDQVIGDVVLLPGAEAGPSVSETPLPLDNTEVAVVFKPSDPLKAASDLARATLLYEEARAAEGRGDALGARRAYLAFAEADLDVIDPYLRFATLLRVQEGRAGAREVLGALAERLKSPALRLAYALQFEGEERLKRLDAILAANKSYGPALYQAALEVSEDRLGRTPTLQEKKRQQALISDFLGEEENGTLTRHFLDQALLGDWIEDARTRLAAANTAVQNVGGVTAQFVRYNGGWNMIIVPPEAALEIFVRDTTTSPDFASTGLQPNNDPRTGKPMPNPAVNLPADQPATIFEVAYTDLTGARIGPARINFQPDSEVSESQRYILAGMTSNWLAARDYDGKMLLYTTMLASYSCALKEVYFGLDGAEPTEKIDLPPCDTLQPGLIPGDFLPYLEIPRDTVSINVQLIWFDGTKPPPAKLNIAAIMTQ